MCPTKSDYDWQNQTIITLDRPDKIYEKEKTYKDKKEKKRTGKQTAFCLVMLLVHPAGFRLKAPGTVEGPVFHLAGRQL